MKITHHRNQDVSFRFGWENGDQTCGSKEQAQAFAKMFGPLNGPFNVMGAVAQAAQEDLRKYQCSFGTEFWRLMIYSFLKARGYPFMQGCFESARKQLVSELREIGAKDRAKVVEAIEI